MAGGRTAKGIANWVKAELFRESGRTELSDALQIEAEARKVAQYRAGKESLLGLFVGEVMKATRGKANPKATSEILERLLSG